MLVGIIYEDGLFKTAGHCADKSNQTYLCLSFDATLREHICSRQNSEYSLEGLDVLLM